MPAMLTSMIEDTRWTLTQVSLGITVWGLAAAAFSPFCCMHIDCFVEVHMALIYGLSNTFFAIGNTLGPAIDAVIYDNTENTRLVYAFCVGTLIVSSLLVSLIRSERDNQTASG